MTVNSTTTPDPAELAVAILGGTGEQGRGLAYRFARAGQRVVVGSRAPERATAVAAELSALPGVTITISGARNEDAAQATDVVILAVPWEGHAGVVAELREALSGKIVVDCVNPLGFDQRGPFALNVPEGSAAEQAASLLPSSRVCAAFHHVSSVMLADPTVTRVEQDVLVLGDDREAVGVVQALASRIDGMRGVYAGRLRNAGQVEAFTANLIAINRRYKTHAGLRVVGLG